MFTQKSFTDGLMKLGNIIKFHLMVTDPDDTEHSLAVGGASLVVVVILTT